MYEPNKYVKGEIIYSEFEGSFIINSKYSDQTRQINQDAYENDQNEIINDNNTKIKKKCKNKNFFEQKTNKMKFCESMNVIHCSQLYFYNDDIYICIIPFEKQIPNDILYMNINMNSYYYSDGNKIKFTDIEILKSILYIFGLFK